MAPASATLMVRPSGPRAPPHTVQQDVGEGGKAAARARRSPTNPLDEGTAQESKTEAVTKATARPKSLTQRRHGRGVVFTIFRKQLWPKTEHERQASPPRSRQHFPLTRG